MFNRREILRGATIAAPLVLIWRPAIAAPRGLILRRGLSYPGSLFRPGIDPQHIAFGSAPISGAAANMLSAICLDGAQMTNLLTGQRGTATTITRVADGILGPAASIGAAGSCNFTNSGTCPATMTFAAIIRITTSNTNSLVSTSTGTGGLQMQCTGGSNALNITITGGSSLLTSTVLCATNVPYFVAASVNLVSATYLCSAIAVNLNTGQIQQQTGTNTSGGAGTLVPTQTGGANVGGFTTFGTTRFATAMMSPIYLSLPQLLIWANDPWSFWYPTTSRIAGFDAELVGNATSAPPSATKLPLLGVGP